MVSLKHKFQTMKANATNASLVRPKDWNAEHDLLLASPNKYLGRDQTAAGAAQELNVVPSGPGDDGTIWTKAAIEAAIAAAVASIDKIPMGTIVGSALTGTGMAGFLPLDGTTFGSAASGGTRESDLFHSVYVHLWPVVPEVEGGRGSGAEADWSAKKWVRLPDATGRVLAACSLTAGDLLNQAPFTFFGADEHVLTVAETPAHRHTFVTGPGDPYQHHSRNSTLAGAGGSSAALMSDSGYDLEIGDTGGGGAHTNIQRTMLIGMWWIKY